MRCRLNYVKVSVIVVAVGNGVRNGVVDMGFIVSREIIDTVYIIIIVISMVIINFIRVGYNDIVACIWRVIVSYNDVAGVEFGGVRHKWG
jgi:hypothetical protein